MPSEIAPSGPSAYAIFQSSLANCCCQQRELPIYLHAEAQKPMSPSRTGGKYLVVSMTITKGW